MSAPRLDRSFLESALTARGGEVGAAVSELVGVGTDSRSVEQGQLFVALRGDRFDGHKFVGSALEKGARAALVDQEGAADLLASEAGVTAERLIVVDDTLIALQDLAHHHLLATGAKRIALSGSNGKTTTKELLTGALRRGLGDAAVQATRGNLNNHIGLPLTALTVVGGVHRAAVLEMGMNHFGELERLCEIARPEVALLTNVGVAHAGNLGGIEGVAKAKGELFEGLSQNGTAVINIDDHRVLAQAERVPAGCRRLTFGRTAADVQLVSSRPSDRGSWLTIRHDEQDADVELALVGAHNALNATGAVAAAVAAGVSFSDAVEGLADAQPSPGRVAVGSGPDNLLIVDDSYNANPDSLRVAVETLIERAGGRRPVVALGNMLELGDDALAAHASCARDAVAQGVTRVFACGELGRGYVEGAREAGLPDDAITWAEDSQALATLVVDALARERTAPGDAVLVKGSRGARMEHVVSRLLEEDG